MIWAYFTQYIFKIHFIVLFYFFLCSLNRSKQMQIKITKNLSFNDNTINILLI